MIFLFGQLGSLQVQIQLCFFNTDHWQLIENVVLPVLSLVCTVSLLRVEVWSHSQIQYWIWIFFTPILNLISRINKKTWKTYIYKCKNCKIQAIYHQHPETSFTGLELIWEGLTQNRMVWKWKQLWLKQKTLLIMVVLQNFVCWLIS